MNYDVLEKRPDETEFAHHRRIIEGKLGDKTLGDYDYQELSRYAFGKEYSADCARRMFYGSKRTLDLLAGEKIASVSDESLLSELDAKMIELRKERQKFNDQRNAFNKVVRERSRQEELNELLTAAVKDGNLPSLDYEQTYIAPSNNDLLVSLNDIHYGANVANAWNTYNSDICRDMMRRYLDKVLSIGETHRSENCIVYNCGDAINGRIHPNVQLENRENVVEQIKGVSELIAEFLAELSPHFNTVRYVSVGGNHSRLGTKDDSPYDERVDDLIEWYLAARLQNFENIIVDGDARVDASMFVLDIRGRAYCGVHGDYEGNAEKITALQTMARKPLYAVLLGHMHHNVCDEIQGVKTIMAGSFLGMNSYCIQKRIYGKPEQMVCVCDDGGVVCHYDVPL